MIGNLIIPPHITKHQIASENFENKHLNQILETRVICIASYLA